MHNMSMHTDHVDVVILGAGPAGAAAAIAAHDAGASVLLAEALAEPGGNARYAAGFLLGLDGPRAVEHLAGLCLGLTGEPVLEAFVTGLGELPGWLESALGAATVAFEPPPVSGFPCWPELPGAEAVRYYMVAGAENERGGEALWRHLAAGLAERGIAVATGTRGVGLELDGGGEVTGVRLIEDGAGDGAAGAETFVTAAGGVVLACGGFERDPVLREAHLPLAPLYPVGHDGGRGDAVRLGAQAGAAPWHMGGFFGWFVFRAPGFPAAFPIDFFGPSWLLLDGDGRRFSDETGWEVHERVRSLTVLAPARPQRARLPLWGVFDDRTRLGGPLNGVVGTPNDYRWSADNAAEVERGWIRTAGSVAELAEVTGLDAGAVAATLAEFNAGAAAGEDRAWGRSPATLAPLDVEHLYAIELWPGVATTSGGPRHDARARVLGEDGAPVGGLWAAGNASSIWGASTHHGGGLCDALVFGRIAGQQAAQRARAAAAPAVS